MSVYKAHTIRLSLTQDGMQQEAYCIDLKILSCAFKFSNLNIIKEQSKIMMSPYIYYIFSARLSIIAMLTHTRNFPHTTPQLLQPSPHRPYPIDARGWG